MGMIKKGEPRCRVFREWTDMLEPLHERAPEKWQRFTNAVFNYVYRAIVPDFSGEQELQELWKLTNVKPYDPVNDKPGYVKIWKKRRAL